MKRSLLCLGILLLSTSCLTIDGRLQVTEAFNVKKKTGFLNLKTKEVRVAPNSYSASLKVKSDKNFVLTLKGGSIGEIEVPIKAERDLHVPENGAFQISHEKINQPFDISGAINTDVQDSDYTEARESCSWSVKENKCDKVCSRETGKCDILCKEVSTTIYGKQDVASHYRTIRRDLQLEFMKADSTGVIARFTGRDIESERIIDRRSECR